MLNIEGDHLRLVFIRVELPQKEEQHPDYKLLHRIMEDEGFLDTIEHRRTGEIYQLPHATYVTKRRGSVSDIETIVEAIVGEVWTKYRILTIRSEDYVWTKLKKVSAAKRLGHKFLELLHWHRD